MGWRRIHALLLASALAAGADPDASVADPLHWSDPRGTASGSRRSRALPVTRDLEDAWRIEMPEEIAAPVVHWDGLAYLLCEGEDARHLVGVDLFEGTVVAKERLPPGPRTRPVVWDRRVFLRVTEEELGEFLLVGKGFNLSWRHRPGLGRISDPVVYDNEIYVVGDFGLARLGPGRAKPVWTVPAPGLRGRPAVYGPHVYVLGDDTIAGHETSLHVYRFARRDGQLDWSANVAWYQRRKPPPNTIEGEITVTKDWVYILPPADLAAEDGAAPSASIERGGNRPARLHSFEISPAVHHEGLIALSKRDQLRWLFWKGENGLVLSERNDQPDLYSRQVPPTVMGDIVYFGTWAADVQTLQILWRLPSRTLRYGLVPADGLILLVEGSRTLRAVRERRRTR